jgi:hypothetical protein
MKKILSIFTACLLLDSAALTQTQKIPLESGWAASICIKSPATLEQLKKTLRIKSLDQL